MGPENDSFEKAKGGELVNLSSASMADASQAPVRLSVVEGYRLWSQTYDLELNPLLALELRTLSPKLGDLSGKVFLDVACGTGRWMTEASSRGARAFGLDLCSEMLAVASGKPRLAGCLMQADSRSLPLRDKFADIVMCSFSVGYVQPLGRVVRELRRVTRPGGTVLISDFHPAAHQEGWRRSFRSGSGVFEIESYRYSADQLVAAGQEAGMRLRGMLEPRLGEAERRIMRDAGKQDLVDQVSAIPAVLILEWERG